MEVESRLIMIIDNSVSDFDPYMESLEWPAGGIFLPSCWFLVLEGQFPPALVDCMLNEVRCLNGLMA